MSPSEQGSSIPNSPSRKLASDSGGLEKGSEQSRLSGELLSTSQVALKRVEAWALDPAQVRSFPSIVMKFGGTSVAGAKQILSSVRLVVQQIHCCPLVVVSAAAGVTDSLIQLLHLAEQAAANPTGMNSTETNSLKASAGERAAKLGPDSRDGATTDSATTDSATIHEAKANLGIPRFPLDSKNYGADQLASVNARLAKNNEFHSARAALEERHHKILSDLSLPIDLLAQHFQQLDDLLNGVSLLGELSPRTRALVSSYGERMMAPIFAGVLERECNGPNSLKASSEASTAELNSHAASLPKLDYQASAWSALELGLLTNSRYLRANPLEECYPEINKRLSDFVTKPQSLIDSQVDSSPSVRKLIVATGFLGCTKSGETTTLGRGGSDYTASIIAKALEVEELQIWTDVDGILTADPRVVPGAKLIDQLSFEEAGELAYSGAKVLHPSTITPARESGIPVRVLNSANPQSAGTKILKSLEECKQELPSPGANLTIDDFAIDEMSKENRSRIHNIPDSKTPSAITPSAITPSAITPSAITPSAITPSAKLASIGEKVQSIAHKTGVQVITIVSPRMLARHGFLSRITSIFDRHQASIDMVATSEVSISLTTDEPVGEREQLLHELEEFAQVEIKKNCAMVSVVGSGLAESSDSISAVFQIAAQLNVKIKMISYGTTGLNLSFLIHEDSVEELVRALHCEFFGC